MTIHEVCNIFPAMTAADYEALRDDIQLHGQLEAIWVWQGQIIDGRHRYRACEDLGFTPRIREWSGQGDLVDFVLSLNLRRRHLTDGQRAAVADKIATMSVGKNAVKGSIEPISLQEAADRMDIGKESVKRIRKVRREGVPELAAAVESGDVTVAAAAEVAKLPQAEQQEVVARGPKAIKEKAAEIRGHSKVNGVAAEDPPDVAKARANGKIPHGAVVTVTEAEPREPGEDDDKEPAEEDLSDEAWLETLPTRMLLGPNARRQFDADALYYRRLYPGLQAFRNHARRCGKSDGSYAWKVKSLLTTDAPSDWAVCVLPEHGGCGGTGQIPLQGKCSQCFGRGYRIKK